MGRFRAIGAVLAAFACVTSPAAADYGAPGSPSGSGAPPAQPAAAEVGANGNPFTGGLSFSPPQVTVQVGDAVRWTNTDAAVPHTVTEDHGLFQLSGTYGATPANPPGFAPGTSVERTFSAGTFAYFCSVHPTQMKGTVTVPLRVRLGKIHHGRYAATITWSDQAPETSQAFDLQEMKGGSAWRTVRDGTSALQARFVLRKGKRYAFRSRVRRTYDPSSASGYSPVATVKR